MTKKTYGTSWELLLTALIVACASLSATPIARATSGTMWVYGNTTLTEDHYGTIILAADYARIDCAGHAIYDSTQPGYCGMSGTESCGISAASIYRGYVINCNVQNFDIGIEGWFVSNMTIRNSTVAGNGDGISFYSSSSTSSDFVLSNTVALNSDEGLKVEASTSLRILSNEIWLNGSDGTDVNGGSGHVFNNNLYWANGLNGLEFDGSPYPSVNGNWFESNGSSDNRNGLSFDNADNFYVSGNTFVSNTRDGFRVMDGSNNGTATGNAGSGNGEHDAHQGGGSTGNTWTSNSFGSTSGI